MKKFILNPNKILENEIDEEVTRVKALIINSNNEILLACLYNEYQFSAAFAVASILVIIAIIILILRNIVEWKGKKEA